MKFKGILLDLDGTLYDYDKAHAAALAAVVLLWTGRTGLSDRAVEDAFVQAREAVHKRLHGTAASHDRLLYFQGACERLGITPFPLALESYRMYWDVFMKNAPFYDGVLDLFETFAHIPIVIVTDLTADVQHAKILAFGLAPRIKALVTSEEAGRDKPDPVIFRLALQKLGVSASEACMIGDHLGRDIEGAAAMGITPFWLDVSGDGLKKNPLTPFKAYRDFNAIVAGMKHG